MVLILAHTTNNPAGMLPTKSLYHSSDATSEHPNTVWQALPSNYYQ
jgi:hypothetical protein